MPENHIQWSAPEFEHYQKSKSWFIVTGIVASLLLLWSLLTTNFLFALLIALSYFTFITYAVKRPKEIQLAITSRGVKVEKAIYEFENLKSFWIFYDPPEIRELSLRSKKTVMPYIKIPLGEQNPVEVRRVLIKYLPERKHKESLIDNLARRARF